MYMLSLGDWDKKELSSHMESGKYNHTDLCLRNRCPSLLREEGHESRRGFSQ